MSCSAASLGLAPRDVYLKQFDGLQSAYDIAAAQHDRRSMARATLDKARVAEKLRLFDAAVEGINHARDLYAEVGDQLGVAECLHSAAVREYHWRDAGAAQELFRRAADLRADAGALRASGQSWHNLAFVQLRLGHAADALQSYARSNSALDDVESQPEAAKAFRDRAFIFSHLTYAAAATGDLPGSIAYARAYFDRVATTGVDREPFLVLLGLVMASTSIGGEDEACEALLSRTRLRTRGIGLYRELLAQQSAGLRGAANGGARVYLGVVTATLVEYGRHLHRSGDRAAAREALDHAIGLAQTRGWAAEASRLQADAAHLDVSTPRT